MKNSSAPLFRPFKAQQVDPTNRWIWRWPRFSWKGSINIARFTGSLLILGLGIVGYAMTAKPDSIAEPAQSRSFSPLVETMQIQPYHLQVYDIKTTGHIVPRRQLQVSAQVAGEITWLSVNCQVGRVVEKGELLAQLDAEKLKLELKELQYQESQARERLKELKAEQRSVDRQLEIADQEWKIAKRDAQRHQQLSRNGAGSDSDAEDARRLELQARNKHQQFQDQAEKIQSQLARLEYSIDEVRIKVSKKELDLKRTTICAPEAGLITKCNIDDRSFVQIGQSLACIQENFDFEVQCSLPLSKMRWVWPQRQPTASDSIQSWKLPATPVSVTWNLEGKVVEVQGSLDRYQQAGVDQSTQTVPLRIKLDPQSVKATSSSQILNGTFVNIEIHAKVDEQLLMIPAPALQPDSTVWTVESGRLAKHRVLTRKALGGDTLLVRAVSSLKPFQQVVTSPLSAGWPGMPVDVMVKK